MARGRPKGIPLSEEAKAKMRAYWTAHYADPANRAKTSAACRSAWADPSQHQRRAAIISGALKGKARPSETGDKIAVSQSRAWADPDARKRRLEGCRKSWATGGRAKDRVVWTDAMDAELARVVASYPWPTLVDVAEERVGVCRRLVLHRMKELRLRSEGAARRREFLERRIDQAASLRRLGKTWPQIGHIMNAWYPLLNTRVLGKYPELRQRPSPPNKKSVADRYEDELLAAD